MSNSCFATAEVLQLAHLLEELMRGWVKNNLEVPEAAWAAAWRAIQSKNALDLEMSYCNLLGSLAVPALIIFGETIALLL